MTFIGKIEFSQDRPTQPGRGRGKDKKPRKPRSDRGRRKEEKPSALKTAASAVGKSAAYLGGLAAGDKIFTGANSAAEKVGGRLAKAASKNQSKAAKGIRKASSRIADRIKANPRARSAASVGRRGAKYAAGLIIGDAAIRGVNKAVGSTVENRHKLKDRNK